MNNEPLYLISIYFICFSVLLLSGILTICCVRSLKREKVKILILIKELEAMKLKFFNGDIKNGMPI